MKDNKSIRKGARITLKRNFSTLVLVCFLVMIAANRYKVSFFSFLNFFDEGYSIQNQGINSLDIYKLSNPDFYSKEIIMEEIFDAKSVEEVVFKKEVNDGIFRYVFDFVTVLEKSAYRTVDYVLTFIVSKESTLALAVVVILAMILYGALWSGPLKVGEARVFLESRLYPKTKIKRMFATLSVKKYINIARTMFIKEVYQVVWSFTIIGGIIKIYSYRMVPMILAENPNIKTNDAIALSNKMMKGKKWQLFKLDLSFIGYVILNICTLGISGVAYTNPYYTASIAEFYSALKEIMLKEDEEVKLLLNDKYLNSNEENFESYLGAKKRERRNMDEVFRYYQKYKASSLIIMFFIFSFIGWLWEVGLYLFKYGTFVNRGTMIGPWLPIYGAGCIIVLLLLFLPRKFKKITDNPILTVILVAGLCLSIEYATSWYLEATRGMRWWDYSGCFMNLNGRICLEGGMFFGLGGTICLYIAAPLLEQYIVKIPQKTRNGICAILVIIFLMDFVYSTINPNIGAGITTNEIIYEKIEDITD